MKKPPSKKHHYLPRYYLRGFTDDDGRFFVYDKNTRRIFRTSPDATFFENNLNTTELPDGGHSDFLEDLYTDVENASWGSLDRIRSSTHGTPIEPMDKMNLFLFLLFLHWRLPSNIDLIDGLSDEFFQADNDLDYFKLLSKTGDSVPKDVVERMINAPAFRKAAKIIVPFAPFFKDKNWWRDIDDWRFIYSGDQNKWFIVGDNPIITRGETDHDPVNCLKEFICPVSGNIVLVAGHRNANEVLPPDFIVQYSAGIIERAQRFVACQNRDFLEALIKYHELHVHHQKTAIIITELFDMIEQREKKGIST